MSTAGYILLVLGGLLAYEALRGLPGILKNAGSSGTGGSTTTSLGSASSGTSNTGTGGLSGAALDKYLADLGLPPAFATIIPRESGGIPTATCFAPGADASRCTPTPKPGDTQGAFGLFQFLNSTWNGLKCLPAAPADPLAVNHAAYDPTASGICAQKAVAQSGLRPWGG